MKEGHQKTAFEESVDANLAGVDLSKASDEVKRLLIDGFMEIIAKEAFMMFRILGLNSHVTCNAEDINTGKKMLISFQIMKERNQTEMK